MVQNLKYIFIEPLTVVITLLDVGCISNFPFAAPLGPAELNLLREEREREREKSSLKGGARGDNAALNDENKGKDGDDRCFSKLLSLSSDSSTSILRSLVFFSPSRRASKKVNECVYKTSNSKVQQLQFD